MLVTNGVDKPRLLVVQRISLSDAQLTSRSIGARFGPLLKYMADNGDLSWSEVLENDIDLNVMREFDALLLNKHSSARGLEIIRNASALGLKTVYDLDDWILDLPGYSVTALNDDIIGNIIAMIREVDYVTVSNDLLGNKLSNIRPDAIVIKNGFDHTSIRYDPDLVSESRNPRVLFSNTDGVKLITYRKRFFSQLIEFLQARQEVEIDFWGDKFPEMHNIPRLNYYGFEANPIYKRKIRDKGYWFALVPLGGEEDPDTLFFNSCKSCIKYIDYGSLGIPGIYSDTPVYSSVLKNGETGILTKNQGDNWIRNMEVMYNSKVLRQKIRKNAYNDCVNNHGLEQSAAIFSSLFSLKTLG